MAKRHKVTSADTLVQAIRELQRICEGVLKGIEPIGMLEKAVTKVKFEIDSRLGKRIEIRK